MLFHPRKQLMRNFRGDSRRVPRDRHHGRRLYPSSGLHLRIPVHGCCILHHALLHSRGRRHLCLPRRSTVDYQQELLDRRRIHPRRGSSPHFHAAQRDQRSPRSQPVRNSLGPHLRLHSSCQLHRVMPGLQLSSPIRPIPSPNCRCFRLHLRGTHLRRRARQARRLERFRLPLQAKQWWRQLSRLLPSQGWRSSQTHGRQQDPSRQLRHLRIGPQRCFRSRNHRR